MNKMSRYRGRRDLLSQLHNDFSRLLAPFEIHSEMGWPEGSVNEWTPSIDVKENDKQYLVHVDLPGVKPADIDVSMENGVLTIKGKRETEKKEEKENYLRIERSSGSFIRQLALPESIDANKIEANCREGVLEVTLPKSTATAGHKIEVKG